jgi:integrase
MGSAHFLTKTLSHVRTGDKPTGGTSPALLIKQRSPRWSESFTHETAVFSFARVGAALAMRVDDVYVQQRRLWVRLREKGGKRHEMPCHHTLDAYLHAYIDGTGIGEDPKGPLFRTIARGTGQLSTTPLPQANAYSMVRRRALAAGIGTAIGSHTFRATGITAYLKNGGTLENAAAMANHASTRTTQLYDRRHDEISLDEVERIRV